MKINKINTKKFGFLTVIKELPSKKNTQGRNIRFFLCKCICGKETSPRLNDLKSGHTTSCGCKFREGSLKAITKHGMYGTNTNISWNNMIQRCTNLKNDKFKDYGARNITVDPEWRLFKNFLKDMGEQPVGKTLERKDNNKGYYKENCSWEDRGTQARNRRTNHLITFNSETKPIAVWAEDYKINYFTLYMRLTKYNWSVEKALSTKVKTLTKS
jgi:hypothetical protein